MIEVAEYSGFYHPFSVEYNNIHSVHHMHSHSMCNIYTNRYMSSSRS